MRICARTCLLSLALGACTIPLQVPEQNAGLASGRDSGRDADVPPPPLDPVHSVDLLFMIDNSLSTIGAQQALRDQIPRLLRALTQGDRDHDGVVDFPPVTSLHLGVVSSDLGMRASYALEHCEGIGDDGVLNDVPNPHMSSLLDNGVADCDARYPRFLTFDAASDDAEQLARDASCIAALGQEGCGVEQPLESALKALWPADDDDVLFTPDEQGGGTRGQGNGGGTNEGFLRSAAQEDTLLVIVMLSIEDDCSHPDPSFLRPPAYLDESVPEHTELLAIGLRTRCPTLTERLHPIERYVDGFRALHPGREDLVMFTAIAGVPPETVAAVPEDFGQSSKTREAFYTRILEHPDMQIRVDTLGTESPDDDTIRPSCEGSVVLRADPPRRLVQIAQAFGENGLVQSVCLDDYAPAVDAILERIADRLQGR